MTKTKPLTRIGGPFTPGKLQKDWDMIRFTFGSVLSMGDRSSEVGTLAFESPFFPFSLTPGLMIFRESDDLSRHCSLNSPKVLN
jgi:hypothetical protein